MRYLSKIIIVSIIMFSLLPLYVIGEVDEQSLFARYTFEVFNQVTSIYDTQNNVEHLIEFGNPTIGYSNVVGIGNYYYFDGNDYLRDATQNGLIANGAFSLNVPQLTICTVVKAVYGTAQLTYFTVSEYGRDGIIFEWIRTTNFTRLTLRDSTGAIIGVNSDRELNSTGWHLITYTYKSGEFLRMYHNKTLVANTTVGILIPQLENRFDIGRMHWGGYYAEGYVGFLEIYTHPVNSRWVEGKYNETFGIEWIPSGAPSAPANNNAWIIGLIIGIPLIVIALKRSRR